MSIAVFVLILALAVLCYMFRRTHYLHRSAEAYIAHISEVSEHRRERLAALIDVLQRSGGGLSKRLSEHAEIETAIREKSPELLAIEPGLTYWLTANGQFFNALRKVMDGDGNKHPLQTAYEADTPEDVARLVANSNIVYTPKQL